MATSTIVIRVRWPLLLYLLCAIGLLRVGMWLCVRAVR